MLVLFVACVAGCAAGGYFLAQSPEVRDFVLSLRPDEKPLEVRIGKVEKGRLVRTVNAPGSIEPKTKVQISAQVSARITALPFEEGQTVKKGDIVVKLDARDLAAALESSQAAERAERARLEGAEASLEWARQELERREALARSGDAARSALESARNDYLRAKSQVDSALQAIEIARANIVRAQKDLENTEIQAPFDGIITMRNVEEGELVLVGTMNNAASVIMEIADLNTMLMKARVDEANVAPIKAGQAAKVFINAYRTSTFTGTVERVGLKRELDRDGTGYYEIEIVVDKPEDQTLYSGLTANTDIEVESFYDVLKLPSQSIVDRRVDDLPAEVRESTLIDRTKAFARVVYTIKDGKAWPVPVSVGSSDLTHSIILSGLEEGRDVIIGPFKVLVDLKADRKVIDDSLKKKGDPASEKAKEGPTDSAGKESEAPKEQSSTSTESKSDKDAK